MFNDGNKRGWILWKFTNNLSCSKKIPFLRNLSSESYFQGAFCLFFSQRPKSSSEKIQYFRMISNSHGQHISVDPHVFSSFSWAFFVGKSLNNRKSCAKIPWPYSTTGDLKKLRGRICSRPLRRRWGWGVSLQLSIFLASCISLHLSLHLSV